MPLTMVMTSREKCRAADAFAAPDGLTIGHSLPERCCGVNLRVNEDHALKRTAIRRRRQEVPLRGTGNILREHSS